MKNAKIRRILLLLACAVLLVSLSVGATLAYLTSTKTVTNTFTVGKVDIKLDEAPVDPETGKAKADVARTETGNTEVVMVPGRLIDKDPTVTVLKGSEDCYVRVKVTVDVSEGFNTTNTTLEGSTTWEDFFTKWANGFANTYIRNADNPGFNTVNWDISAPVIKPDASTITYVLTYKKGTDNIVAKATTDTSLEPVFTHIEVPGIQDKDDLSKLAGMSINVVAEAIQAEGFATEAAAWQAFENQP